MKKIVSKLKKSILTRMIATFMMIIIPLYILGSAIYGWAVQTVKDETSRAVLSKVEFYLDNLDVQITHTRSLLLDCINDVDLKQLASIPESLDDYEKAQAITRLEKRLAAIVNSGAYIYDVKAYVPAINRVIKTTEGGYVTQLSEEEFRDAGQAAKNKDDQIVYWNENFYLFVTCPAVTIRENIGDNMPLFILAAEFSQDEIEKTLRQFSDTEGEGALLINFRYNVIMANLDSNGINDRIREMLDRDPSSRTGTQTVTKDNRQYLVMYSRSDTLGALLSVCVSESVLYRKIHQYAIWFWLFTVLALMLVAAYSFITYRQIHKPLVKLAKSFKRLEKGDMGVAIEHEHDDEFKYLYSAFNEMVGKLNVLIDQVYKQKILAQHAQLKQLQSQINPHFLYNSFFMLQRMVQAEDYENLSVVSEQLGNYFKYITRSAADNVELAEEVAHARIYAGIQALRFRNRIRIDFTELPVEYRTLPVPRLILQPVIENSIEHGMKDIDENGIIKVCFHPIRSGLSIVVEDNGGGIGDEALIRLAEKMNAEDDRVESTGIINIHRRIKLMFGHDSGLLLSKAENGGIRMEIRMRYGEEKDVQAADS
jgi:two-component system sensor histidine kinase YesM